MRIDVGSSGRKNLCAGVAVGYEAKAENWLGTAGLCVFSWRGNPFSLATEAKGNFHCDLVEAMWIDV